MRIAIPVAETTNTIAEEFSRAPLFALYDVDDESRTVAYVGRHSLAQPGCGTTPGFLRGHGVEVIMAHRISENAVNHLLEAGIVSIKDTPALSPDALMAHLVSGTLQATPPEAAMHGGGCGSGGCGHCGHEHAHENHAAQAAGEPAAPGQGHECGGHGCGNACG